MAPFVEAIHLTKSYDGAAPAVDDLSFEIPSGGRVTALVGPNGAGKTTLTRLLATQLSPTSGTVVVLGYDAQTAPREVRSRIAMLPQDAGPYLMTITVRDQLVCFLMIRGYSRRDAENRATTVLAESQLEDVANRPIGKLSGGQKRRTLLATTLAPEVDGYFLDEPTTGLDIESRLLAWQAVRRRTRDGASVVLTSHYGDEIVGQADELMVLVGGHLLRHGTAVEVLRSSLEGVSQRIEVRPPDDVSRVRLFRFADEFGCLRITVGEITYLYPSHPEGIVEKLVSQGYSPRVSPLSAEDVVLSLMRPELSGAPRDPARSLPPHQNP